MARKTLEDFNNDYQAYADYLESAECADDDDYDMYVDEKGNIYERTDGSWQKDMDIKKLILTGKEETKMIQKVMVEIGKIHG